MLPRDIAESRSARSIDQAAAQKPRPPRELYDLTADPGELHNLVDDPAHRETQRILAETLAQWRERTGDTIPEEAEGDAIAERFTDR